MSSPLPLLAMAAGRLPLLALLFALALNVGCGVDLQLPPDVPVTCGADAACPSDGRCNTITGLCEFNVGVSAPSTAFAQVGPTSGRAATMVRVELDALDSNAPPVGDETVSFGLAYSRDGVTWCDATLVQGVTPVVGAEATRVVLTWNALADAGACGLVATAIAASPEDDAPPITVLAYAAGVRLRLTATDSGVPASRSEIVSPPFALGNDAPVLGVVDDGSVLRQASPFEYTLADSSLDESRIEVQFRLEGATPSPWYTASVRGSTAGVVADAPGTAGNRLLVWNADAALPPDTSTPGGIGRTNGPVSLRARAVETVLGDITTYGAWSGIGASVLNQTPPVVGGIEVAAVEGAFASSIVIVAYDVIDAERDVVDVRVEYSIDDGGLWKVASALPIIQHSGTLDLATRESAPERHTFVWNVAQDIPRRADNVLVRVTAADDGGAGVGAVAVAGFGVGLPDSSALNDLRYPVAATGTYLSPDTASRDGTLLLTGDINGDGRADAVVWALGSLEYFPTTMGGGIGTRSNRAAPASRTRALVVADLNGDGRADVLARNHEDPLQVGLGSAGGPVYSTVSVPFCLKPLVATGDFDGDGKIDLAVNGYTTVSILRGNGDGTFGAAETFNETTAPNTGSVYAMTAGDFDGDGRADLATAVANGPGFGQTFKITGLDVRVRYGDATALGTPPFRSGFDLVAQGTGINEDENAYSNAALDAGDLRGDGKLELVFADMLQSNVGRLRLLAREAAWQTVGTVSDLPLVRRVTYRSGPPAHVVAGNTNGIRAYSWDRERGLFVLEPTSYANINDIAFADRNDDGVADVLVATKTNLTARLRVDAHGVPTGAFTEADDAFVIPSFTELSVVTDFDHDGLADVWALDALYQSNHAITMFRSASLRDIPQARLAIANAPLLMVPPNAYLTGASDFPGVGDVNGDGAPDVILGTYDTSFYVTLGNGVPFAFTPAAVVAAGTGSGKVVLGDFDDDGRDDVLGDESMFHGVHYARGPAGSLTSWEATPLGINGRIAAGDLDGDGIDDVIGSDYQADTLSVWFGGQAGLTGPCTVAIPGANDPTAIAVGDIAGRGRPQVVVFTDTHLYAWSVQRCSYSGHIAATIADGLEDVAFIDVDGDGVLDLTGLGFNTPNVYMAGGRSLGGRPTGAFEPLRILRTDGRVASWGDVNRDGLPDLFVARADERLSLHINHRFDPGSAWSYGATASDIVQGAPRATDRFGAAYRLPFSARPVADPSSGAVNARDMRSSFASRLRRSAAKPPAAAVAISLPWRFDGLLASSAASGTGARHVRSVLSERELIVELPLYGDAPTDPAKFLAYARIIGEYESDADGTLPRTADGRTQWREVDNFTAVTRDLDGDLATGTGPRYVYEPARRVLRIATDRPGVFQAFAIP